jgi:serine/threonine-protein kinase HipA
VLTCGDLGRWANAGNLLTQCRRFLLSAEEARAIIDAMERAVAASWYPTLRAAGVTEQDAVRLRGAFVYPGFRRVAAD